MNDINHLTEEERELLIKLIKDLKLNFVRDYVSGFESIVTSDKKSNYHLREDVLKTEDEELYIVYTITLFPHNKNS